MAVENINTYQGNAALGQGTAGGEIGPIGTSEMKKVGDAMDKLVQYQVLYNRDKWARNNLLVDRDAKDAAEAMTFTIGDWLQGDRDTIMGKINKMNDLYKTNPNRTRLLSDGSNADAVAEFQQVANDIQADIARANRRKTQSLALNEQYAKATDEDDKNDVLKWKENSEKTDISKDILLAPTLTPFIPLTTPDASPIDVGPTYDDKGNIESVRTITLPDIGAGMANYSSLMSSTKGRKAREFVGKGKDDFNSLIAKIKEQEASKNPGQPPNETDIYNALKATEEGRTKLDLLERANQLIKRNNQYLDQTGMAELDEIKWMDGIDENDYIKMLVGGGATSVGDKLKTTKVGLGIEEEQLRQGRVRLAQQAQEMRDRANQWKLSFDATQEKKVDPLIKNSAIATLLTAPYQPGATVDANSQMTDIPVNQDIKNMFNVPIPEAEVEKVVGTDQKTKTKFSNLDIVSVQAEKVGNDPNDTKIHVKYKNPITGDETENVYDRAALNLPANNVLGAGANSYKVADADADFKKKVGTNNPRLEQMFPQLGATGSATGNTSADPLTLPMKAGKRDNTKMQKGKWYKFPNGDILQYNGK